MWCGNNVIHYFVNFSEENKSKNALQTCAEAGNVEGQQCFNNLSMAQKSCLWLLRFFSMAWEKLFDLTVSI